MTEVAVVNTGVANFGSIESAFSRVGGTTRIAICSQDIERASHIVLPGVGSFDVALQNIDQQGLRDVIRRRVDEDNIPLLGICLGMQLLGFTSEEGDKTGLGFLDGRTTRLVRDVLKVPHIGWNSVTWDGQFRLMDGITSGERFYFVHSYHYVATSEDDVVGRSQYGGDVTAIVQRGNVVGTQFHPEKSRAGGLLLLRNFLRMTPND